MTEVLGLAGTLLFFAGLHLLWQAREEGLYWLQKFLETFQKSLRSTAGLPTASESEGPAAPAGRSALRTCPPAAWRMMSGFGLLLLGPMLVLLSLFLSS